MRLRYVVAALLCTFSTAAAAQTYDLSGLWRFAGLESLQSFCDGSSSEEVITGPLQIVQTGESVTLTFPDPPGSQVFQGRTSMFVLGAESGTPEAITVLTGTVANDANRITGTLVFFDLNACPDAEAGSARFVLTRVQ